MTTNSTPTTPTSREDRRAARRRAWEMADKIDDARRRGYARILRREIKAIHALLVGAKQDLESCEFGRVWEAHLGVYMALKRELIRRHYYLAFWEGRKAAQKRLLEQNPWL